MLYYVLLLLFLPFWTCAGSNIEFNITQVKEKSNANITKLNESNIVTLKCNDDKTPTFEVQHGNEVKIIVKFYVIDIERAWCAKTPKSQFLKNLTLRKQEIAREHLDPNQEQSGNTFMDAMEMLQPMQGIWYCSFIFLDTRYPKLNIPSDQGKNSRRIDCPFELNVIFTDENFFTKYQTWIIVAASVVAIVIIIIIVQTIVILHFRARVKGTEHIRPLTFLTNRTDHNRYSTNPGRRHRKTTTHDSEPGIYESVENVNVASAPNRDISQRPPLPLPAPTEEKETFRLPAPTPSPPPISTLPREARRPLFLAPPKQEDFPPPPPQSPVEVKPVKAPDPMINELGNRLKKRRNVTARIESEQSEDQLQSEVNTPLLPKKNIQAPYQMNSPPLPAKPHNRPIRMNVHEMESPHFLPLHLQIPSPTMRSMEVLKTPCMSRSRPYMPEHMQSENSWHMRPENSFHMQPSKDLPKRKAEPPHMRSTPDVNAALPIRMRHMQSSPHMQPPSRINISVAPDVKIPPPVPRKACIQLAPAISKPKLPSPRSSGIADNETNSEDEDWVYEDLEPMHLYNL